jgi:SAM-dependent methyltransferase
VSGAPGENITAAHFDEAFTQVEASPALVELFMANFDPALPPEVEPYSYVPLSGLREIAAAFQASGIQRLVDVGCGRGGPGLWVARELGCRLTGVDLSAVAVEQARRRAGLFGVEAAFEVGAFDSTGLADAAADAVMSVDAMHFAADAVGAAAELFRICAPGGRLAITTWRVADGPPRLKRDIAGALKTAGWTLEAVEERPGWLELQAAFYRAVLALTPEQVDAAPGVSDVRAEAQQVGPLLPRASRYLVIATR